MPSSLLDLDLASARRGLLNKDFSAVELAEAYLQECQAGAALNAYITETPDVARAMAKSADAKLKSGDEGALLGIPVAVKDIFCTRDIRTTAASHILDNFVPPYESTVTARLWQAGAVLLGKTNMDEFAMGSTNENSYFGACKNPCKSNDSPDTDFVPGGSSGGSAAAVAAHLALAALGTDTGGSIRQPASFCGIVGIKPTYGRCSRYGIIAFASSLDQAGVLTRSVESAAIMLGVMCGYDAKDSTSARVETPDFTVSIGDSVKGMKIGIPSEFRNPELNSETAQAWDEGAEILRASGAEIVSVSLPMAENALAAYYIIAPAEASSNLARYDGVRYGLRQQDGDLLDMYCRTRGAGFGAEVKRRIMIGTYVLSAGYYDAYYAQAQKLRRLLADDFSKAFEACDVILTPTTPHTATAIQANSSDPLAAYWLDVYTVPVSLAGLPAISLPMGYAGNGLPLGLQLIGRAFDESRLLSVAHALESGRPV